MKKAHLSKEQEELLEVLSKEFNEDKDVIASIIFELGVFLAINYSIKILNKLKIL